MATVNFDKAEYYGKKREMVFIFIVSSGMVWF